MIRYLSAALALAAALALGGCGSVSSPVARSASHSAPAPPVAAPSPTFSPYSENMNAPVPQPPARPAGCVAARGAVRWTLANSSEGVTAVLDHLKGVVARIPVGALRTDTAKFGGAIGLAVIYTNRGNTSQADKMSAAAAHWASQIRHKCRS